MFSILARKQSSQFLLTSDFITRFLFQKRGWNKQYIYREIARLTTMSTADLAFKPNTHTSVVRSHTHTLAYTHARVVLEDLTHIRSRCAVKAHSLILSHTRSTTCTCTSCRRSEACSRPMLVVYYMNLRSCRLSAAVVRTKYTYARRVGRADAVKHVVDSTTWWSSWHNDLAKPTLLKYINFKCTWLVKANGVAVVWRGAR